MSKYKRKTQEIKVISSVVYPDGSEKLLSDLTPEEREKWADWVNTMAARILGYEVRDEQGRLIE